MNPSPAIDILYTPEAERAIDLHDRLLARLDDFHPTAIEESATSWRVFFDSTGARDSALASLRDLKDSRLAFKSLEVDDEDWARRSQADLPPVRIGRIVVTPPWAEADARRDALGDDVVLVVMPSTGFGTGHHASTRLCLALLQQVPVEGRTVVDIGTGSGVLALAAARLGAGSVLAIDNDPDAVDAARQNFALNLLDARVNLECADLGNLQGARAGIVLANLTGELLRRKASDVVELADRGSDVVVSGVLAEEQDTVVKAFEAAGARLATVLGEDEWVGLRFVVGD